MNMAGSRVLGGVTVLLQNQKGLSSASLPLDSLFLSGSSNNSSSSSSSFLGTHLFLSYLLLLLLLLFSVLNFISFERFFLSLLWFCDF